MIGVLPSEVMGAIIMQYMSSAKLVQLTCINSELGQTIRRNSRIITLQASAIDIVIVRSTSAILH